MGEKCTYSMCTNSCGIVRELRDQAYGGRVLNGEGSSEINTESGYWKKRIWQQTSEHYKEAAKGFGCNDLRGVKETIKKLNTSAQQLPHGIIYFPRNEK